jgi:hypothetical protein
MSLLHDVLSFLAKCRGADVYQATVQAFGSGVRVQTVASTGRVDGHDLQPQGLLHSLAFIRFEGDTEDFYKMLHWINWIVLLSLEPLAGELKYRRRYRVSISARRLRASCGRVTEVLEGAVAARAVQAEALRRIRGGLTQQDENPITEPRPKRPRGSGRPRRGAHCPDRPHATRNTSGSRRVTFAPQLVHYPPDKPLQYTTPKPGPLETVLHETTEFSPGLRHQVQQRLPAWEEIGRSGQSGDELVARGRAHSVETRGPAP